MDYIKCSEKELTAMEKALEGLQEFVNVTTSESDLSYDIQMTNDHKLDNLIYDINDNELFKNWLNFKNGVTKVTAYDAVNGTGAQIIEKIYGVSEKVFGYYEKDSEKIFFISEIQENWIDNFETQDNLFLVEETKVCLSECMKNN